VIPAAGAIPAWLQHHSAVAGETLTSAPTKQAWLRPKYITLDNIQDASSIQWGEEERKKKHFI